MSHSKPRKRGQSLYLNSWNKSAKRFIIQCRQCGHEGFSPTVLDSGFVEEGPDGIRDKLKREAVRAELVRAYEPLELDEVGLCRDCQSATQR